MNLARAACAPAPALVLLLVVVLALAGPARAQEAGEAPLPIPPAVALARASADDPRPQQPAGQHLPLMPTRRLRADVSAGTWMSLDIAPDGRAILFDILGDLYTMPAKGGRATRISGGLPFETQATYAPDGRWIAFVSDRSGADNLWIARPDGSGARQVTFGDDDTVLVSPAWAADGRSITVSRYRADLNNYELWRYDLAGKGALLSPIRDMPSAARDRWRSTIGAVPSADGRFLYYARHEGEASFTEAIRWTIVRRELASGTERTIVALPDGPRSSLYPGAFFRPAISPDGRLLAYGARTAGETELRLRDLVTGEDRRLAGPIEHDQLQASMWQDIIPRYGFTPDGTAIMLSVRGGIERIAVADGRVTSVPFTAPLDVAIGPSTRQDIREESGPIHARLIMQPVASPDGRNVAFSALGRLYLMRLERGATPHAVATGADPVFQPSWSPDGKILLWVSWTEKAGGAIWSAPADGSAAATRLTDLPAYYSFPVFTPDGRSIVAIRSGQQARLDLYMEYARQRDADLVMLPSGGGAARVVTHGRIGSRPQFAQGKAYVLADDGLDAVDLATGARSLAVQVDGPGWYFQDGAVPVDDLRISPDGKWLLAQVAQQLHLLAMPATPGTTVDLSDPHLLHRRLTDGGADYFEWSNDGRRINWSSGSTFHVQPLAGVEHNAAERPGSTADAGGAHYHADVIVPRAIARGRLLLHDARLLSMAPGDPLIAHADILIEDGRFARVGPVGSFTIPADSTIRDLAGRTVVPGFIDTHDHVATVRREILGLEDWGLRARLAYGVTTSFDPSTLTIDMLPYQDLLDAGLMTGPRIRQTGVALFSMQRFTSLDQVRAVIRRYRDDYGLRNIKEYRTGSRKVRQWVAQACAELGMNPTTEGALAMKLDLSQILDGFAGNEHALVASPLQDDILALLKTTRTSYTTTLEITNGGFEGQDWSIATDQPFDDPAIVHWWPELFRAQSFLHREWRPLGEYRFPAIAADAAAVQAGGGLVGIGSHGEAPGIGFHYEMELHATGLMTPAAILHAATIGSAETIGRKADLGSIEPGKIADLVILGADPLADIRNARAVLQVMRDGRLYDAATLDTLWPEQITAPASWFAAATPSRWLPAADER